MPKSINNVEQDVLSGMDILLKQEPDEPKIPPPSEKKPPLRGRKKPGAKYLQRVVVDPGHPADPEKPPKYKYVYTKPGAEGKTHRWKLTDEHKARLDSPEAKAGIKVIDALKKAGHEAYLVGGAVRDLLLGKSPKDYDVVTSAKPDEVKRVFPKVYDVGEQFAITPVMMDDEWVEIATYRTETGYSDKRRPDEIKFADTLEEDAKRRDFTINGLYLDPVSGHVVDAVDGVKDLKNKTLRTIGKPEDRFNEDALRLMRAVRFASTLGFDLDPDTAKAVKNMAGDIKEISNERVRDELVKIITKGGAAQGLQLMDELGLLEHVLPEVHALHGIKQPEKYHPEGDAYQHTAKVLEALDKMEKPSKTLALAALLHDIGKTKETQEEEGKITSYGHDKAGAEMAEEVADRLKLTKEEKQRVIDLVRDHMVMHFRFKDMSAKNRRKWMMKPHFEELIELGRLDKLGGSGDLSQYKEVKRLYEEFKEEQEKYQKPVMQGRDLIDMGFKPGAYFGPILQEVRDLQLDGKINTLEEAKKYVSSKYSPEKSWEDPEYDIMAGLEWLLKFRERIVQIDPPDPAGVRGLKRETFRLTLTSGQRDYVDKLPKGAKPGALYDPDKKKVISEKKEKDPAKLWQKLGVQSPYFKRWFGDWEKDPDNSSKVVDEDGEPLVVMHGTTNIFDAFNTKAGHADNDFGRGAYFTNSEDDVNANYAGEGPDLTSRIEQLAERIEQEEEIDYEDAKKKAKKQLSRHAGSIIPAYLNLRTPFVMGGEDETFLDYSYGPSEDDVKHFMDEAKEQLMEEHDVEEGDDPEDYFDEDEVRERAREIAIENNYEEESGALVDFIDALKHVCAQYYETDVTQATQDVMDEAFDYGGVSAKKLFDKLKGSEGLMYATDEEGKNVTAEIIRETLERMGFDGVIDRSVYEKFGKGMKGVREDTVHYIAFQPNQIKSAIGNPGTFDPDHPNMTKDVLSGLDWFLKAAQAKPFKQVVQDVQSGAKIDPPDPMGAQGRRREEFRITPASGKTYYVPPDQMRQVRQKVRAKVDLPSFYTESKAGHVKELFHNIDTLGDMFDDVLGADTEDLRKHFLGLYGEKLSHVNSLLRSAGHKDKIFTKAEKKIAKMLKTGDLSDVASVTEAIHKRAEEHWKALWKGIKAHGKSGKAEKEGQALGLKAPKEFAQRGSERYHYLPVEDDIFVHYTTPERAKQILESGKLLMRPPYEKFGIDAVNAVSTSYGWDVPGVQSTHIKNGDELVAIKFRTKTKPEYGSPEEVVWHEDVELIDPEVISQKDAVETLRSAPFKISEDDLVIYDKDEAKEIKEKLSKKEKAMSDPDDEVMEGLDHLLKGKKKKKKRKKTESELIPQVRPGTDLAVHGTTIDILPLMEGQSSGSSEANG
jgi:poly(A) polymerase